MRLLVFGGTSEGRNLAFALEQQNHDVTVSVATQYGADIMGDASRVRIVYGRKDADGIKELISGMDAVIDATHPYAKEVTGLIFKACSDCGIAYYRYARPKSELDTHVIPFASKQEAIGYLSGTEGNILLTTGAKELTDYAVLGSERLYVRVLPMPDSLAACEAAGIEKSHILALQGPFSAEFNLCMIREYNIRFMVSKDGGAAGGFPEKMKACRMAHIPLVLIGRDDEEGFTAEEILAVFAADSFLHETSDR